MLKNILKKIIGSLIIILLTLNFSNAYYDDVKEDDNNIIILYAVPIVGILISGLLWLKYGKDNQVIETVEFYPPKGFNSLELGYIYKGKANVKDVSSLFVYLANKGYISIHKNNVIEKLKDYDGDNYFEREFLSSLFKKDENFVNLDDIDDYFYITIANILNEINSKKNKEKIFYRGISFRKFIVFVMIILSIVTTISIPAFKSRERIEIFAMLFCIPYIFLMRYIIIKKYKDKKTRFITNFFSTILIILIVFSTYTFKTIILNRVYLVGVLISILSIVGMILTFKNMPRRTEYGNKILGEILGFKKFLETAKKEELELKVLENPKYFYDILPFTYVLDVSNVWIEKFENIEFDSVISYNMDNICNESSFWGLMDNIANNIKSKIF